MCYENESDFWKAEKEEKTPERIDWQSKYDELKEIVKDYTFKIAELNQANDELKAENEQGEINLEMWKSRHKFLIAEHATLKAKARGLVEALESILEIGNAASDGEIEPFTAFGKIAYTANKALSSWNSKEQKEGEV